MKKKLTTIFFFIIIFGSTTLGYATILYQNNFDDGNLSDWTHIINYWGEICGSWSVIDGALQAYVPCSAQDFKLDTLILPDSYSIEFDTKTITDGGGFSLIGFYTHWSTWSNWVGHGYRPGRFYIEEIVSGTRLQRYNSNVFGGADKLQWHHFKYIKDGDRSSLYYDGQVVYENQYFPISLTDGYFVLTAAPGTHQFDNLVIRTLEISIEDILTSFDGWVSTEEDLVGIGPGNSANGRLNALRNMLETAGDLIHIGDIEGACGQLKAASKKCDGESKPPDFVAGEAVEELYDMIVELMEELGCE